MRKCLAAFLAVALASLAVAAAQTTPPDEPAAEPAPSPAADPPAAAEPAEPAEPAAETPAADPAEAARRDKPLARIADRTLSVGEFEDQLSSPSVPLPVRASFDNPERIRLEFEQRIERMALAAWAARQGLESRPDLLREIRKLYRGITLYRQVHQQIDEASVPDADVQAYYESHPEAYHRPETANAGMILLADRPAAEAALERALAAQGNRADLTRAVRELSTDDETKRRGGSLGYFDRDGKPNRLVAEGQPEPPRVDPAIVAAAFTLTTPFDVYPQVVDSVRGPAVVFLLSRTPAVSRTLEEAAPRIRLDLLNERRDALRDRYLADARARFNVKVLDAAFEHVVVTPGEPDFGPPTNPPFGTMHPPTPVAPPSGLSH
ncbi:MAG: peptidyl-prolyl cis-trans isomerase [Deltaproteobacteria bacterium]|nr:peptidyl-prolyl cis-trans isomerase [Deltaproteobacteria bacterium]